MGQAEEALGAEDARGATERQARALDRLRKGAQQLSDRMSRGREGQADNQRGGRDGERDPLGRRYSNERQETDGNSTKVPKDIDTQRARRILEELRKRLGESGRPPGELDYLERLLRTN
jgi:Domain of unknown function (DUF4175)